MKDSIKELEQKLFRCRANIRAAIRDVQFTGNEAIRSKYRQRHLEALQDVCRGLINDAEQYMIDDCSLGVLQRASEAAEGRNSE